MKKPPKEDLDIINVLQKKEKLFLEKTQFETQSDYQKRKNSEKEYFKLVEQAVLECKKNNSLPYYLYEHNFRYDAYNLKFIIGDEMDIPFDRDEAKIFYDAIYNNKDKMFHIFIIPKDVILTNNTIKPSSALILFDLYQGRQITNNFRTFFGTLAHLDINRVNLNENHCFISKNLMINIRRDNLDIPNKNFIRLPLYNIDDLDISPNGKIKEGLYYYIWNNETFDKNQEQSIDNFINNLDKLEEVPRNNRGNINEKMRDLFGNGSNSN